MKIRFNLLPEAQKKHLQTQKFLRMIIEQEIYILVVIGIFVLSLYGMFFIIKTEVLLTQGVERRLVDQNGYDGILNIHALFKDTHVKVNMIDDLRSQQVVWSQLLTTLSDMIPESIVVESLSTSGTRITIVARAQTREDVVTFKDRLGEATMSDVQCFEQISVPESDLVAPTNVTFTISFTVNRACVK
jgi:hypothetical protein